jgi:preprotein translocase subunit SecA
MGKLYKFLELTVGLIVHDLIMRKGKKPMLPMLPTATNNEIWF